MLFTAANHCSRPLKKQKRLAPRGQKFMCVRSDWRILINFVSFCIFCGQSVVAMIMIDGSKTRKSLVGVEVQCPYVIERRRKGVFVYLLM